MTPACKQCGERTMYAVLDGVLCDVDKAGDPMRDGTWQDPQETTIRHFVCDGCKRTRKTMRGMTNED